MFTLHPQLERDSELLGRWPLSQVRLMRDGELSWLILIPMRANKRDLDDLAPLDQQQLIQEIDWASKILKQHDPTGRTPDKINVAALGNLVPQLHIHVVARFRHDRAWPAPCFGTQSPHPFDPQYLEAWKKVVTPFGS